jgi:UTP:GlnB (protein PII) uridylyltransferase
MSANFHREKLAERIRKVIAAPTHRLDHLVQAAGLDPATDLRFGDWSMLDLAGADLRGYDLTGSNLTGSNFEGARIDGARFSGANLTGVKGLPRSIREAVGKSRHAIARLRVDDATQVRLAQQELRAELKGWSEAEFDRHFARFQQSYWLTGSLRDRIGHARFLRRAELKRVRCRVQIEFDILRNVVVFTTLSPDYPSLLAVVAGACYSFAANIVDACIHTTNDRLALDTILVSRSAKPDEDEVDTLVRLARVMEGRMKTRFLPKVVDHSVGRRGDLSIKPEVFVDNGLSSEFTVVEVVGPDRPGLLYELTRKLFEAKVNIASANVRTFAGRASDVFHVTDFQRRKIESLRQRRRIEQMVMEVFTPGREC